MKVNEIIRENQQDDLGKITKVQRQGDKYKITVRRADGTMEERLANTDPNDDKTDTVQADVNGNVTLTPAGQKAAQQTNNPPSATVQPSTPNREDPREVEKMLKGKQVKTAGKP